jgi:hypothetical protein
MNIREAWYLNNIIHNRKGISLTLHPERQTADMHITMAIEVCVDYEEIIYLPRIAKLLRLPHEALYVEQDELGMVWVAIDTTILDLPAAESSRIAAFLRVPIDDGWFPGPAPLPSEQPGSFWHQAYRCLNDEPEHAYWEITQPAYKAVMKYTHRPPTRAGGQIEWGFDIAVNYNSLGWFPESLPAAINTALTQAGIPLNGWYTAREAERHYALGVMRRAGIIR